MLRYIPLLLTCFTLSLHDTNTYYVSGCEGNDANTGTSKEAAWQTLAKVTGETFVPGDSILLKRGEIFEGTLTLSDSGSAGQPIVIDAYGNGEAPIISGSDAVFFQNSDWSLHVPNVYVADYPQTPVYIFENGKQFRFNARHPNVNYGSDF